MILVKLGYAFSAFLIFSAVVLIFLGGIGVTNPAYSLNGSGCIFIFSLFTVVFSAMGHMAYDSVHGKF